MLERDVKIPNEVGHLAGTLALPDSVVSVEKDGVSGEFIRGARRGAPRGVPAVVFVCSSTSTASDSGPSEWILRTST